MNKKHLFKSLFIAAIALFSSCNSEFWFDFLLGPQPKFIEEVEFEPALNILGVIRPDSANGIPMSFVLLNQLMQAVTSEIDTTSLKDADIEVSLMEDGQPIQSFTFAYDSTQQFPTIYRPIDFSPQAGNTYSLRCYRDGFPELTATTTVPQVPVIEDDFISVSGNALHFSIVADSTAALYDIYLFSGFMPVFTRTMKAQSGNTSITLKFNGNLSDDAVLAIYAYDSKLSAYVTSPNVFFKPNTYRPPFTNVDGGYGCFGSLNLLVRTITP